MAENTATLSATGGQPEVELIIGQLQLGDHMIILFDKNGKNGVVVGKNPNGTPVAVRYEIPRPLAELDGNILRWNCIIGTTSLGTQNASVTLRVIQDGQVVPGGEIVTRKKIQELDIIKDRARLIVK